MQNVIISLTLFHWQLYSCYYQLSLLAVIAVIQKIAKKRDDCKKESALMIKKNLIVNLSTTKSFENKNKVLQ